MGQTRRITVAGAGAVGCTLAAKLANAGHRVSMLARGRTLSAIREAGVRLDDLSGSVRVRVEASAEACFGVQDMLFLCSKSHDLPSLGLQCASLIGPETLIVPLVNGVPFWYFHREGGRFEGRSVRTVDPDGAMRAALPLDQVIGAVTFLTAESPAPGHASSGNPHLLMFGELGKGYSPRLAALCAMVTAAGIEGQPIDDIRDKLWTKIVANLTSNPLSVVSGETLDRIYSQADLLAHVRAVMHEVFLVASCYGARMTVDPLDVVRLGAAMGPVRTSMLQDFQRGQPLELPAIGDAVLELAALYQIPMPSTQSLLAQVRELCKPIPA